MPTRSVSHRCVLMVLADGYSELEAITILSFLREAGICVKSVGLTSGLAGGVHGVWLRPDLTLAELELLAQGLSIDVVILPGGGQSLAQLEIDARVPRLLRQVVAQGGSVVVSPEGKRLLKAADLHLGENGGPARAAVVLREPGQSPETFARDLIYQLM